MKKLIAMFAVGSMLMMGSPVFAQHQQEEKHENAPRQQQHQKAPKQTHQQKQVQHENGNKERGGRLSTRGGERRIPNDRFRENFGRGHYFQVNEGEFRAGRFEYGGFAFGFVEPWPAYWAYSDDVYVDDIDGVYFLLNPRFPGERVEVVVQ